jgi:hypothetical protein
LNTQKTPKRSKPVPGAPHGRQMTNMEFETQLAAAAFFLSFFLSFFLECGAAGHICQVLSGDFLTIFASYYSTWSVIVQQ